MSNTYTQIHIQAIFAVKFREALIHPVWQERMHQFMTGILQNHGHKMIAINSMPDHLHLFFGLRPTQALSDLIRIVKGESSEWINKNKFTSTPFRWQEGYSAFSYSHSDIPKVATYIEQQQAHHATRTFLDEYEEFLKKFQVEYDQQYIYKPLV